MSFRDTPEIDADDAAGPSPARIHDCFLGGKDHYAADRLAAAALLDLAPGLGDSAAAARRFMTRAVYRAATFHGIAQFLDIGAGLPCHRNVHEVAQQFAPSSRVTYVDNDPAVVAQARALLTGDGAWQADVLLGDLRRPAEIAEVVTDRAWFDVQRPVAVLLVNVLHVVPGQGEAHRIIAELLAPWPAGSMLVIATFSHDANPRQADAVEDYCSAHDLPAHARTDVQIHELFTGLRLQAPGVVPIHRWRSGGVDHALDDDRVLVTGGVALVP